MKIKIEKLIKYLTNYLEKLHYSQLRYRNANVICKNVTSEIHVILEIMLQRKMIAAKITISRNYQDEQVPAKVKAICLEAQATRLRDRYSISLSLYFFVLFVIPTYGISEILTTITNSSA